MSNEKRTALYGVVSAVLAAASVFGFVTAEEAEVFGVAGASALGAISQLISAVKTWKQRGESALVTLKFDGTNADKARSIVEALEKLRGAA